MSSPTTRADATTTVRVYQQVVYDGPAEGPALSRIHLGELFSGDIEACGITEFLQATHADGSASFVGIERVVGTLGGRRGTFLIESTGSLSGNEVSAEWRVIPGSGTDELAGLRGTGNLRSKLGEGGTVHLDYWHE
ncbi:MAG: DUF3224 domain-containing protein [Xanthomonadales bacterium]|nr:DUF3224 domain-containing protein [Xanthomonadales bacterium]ODU92907.1 MAG: hypothetical protein ABT18_10460 [Rhodanobacter sp. SCN 66-43]OJY83697.1 MAG: hypothetical protein BGP23_13685 [Xanthomonadales bacterium 66-474]